MAVALGGDGRDEDHLNLAITGNLFDYLVKQILCLIGGHLACAHLLMSSASVKVRQFADVGF